MYLTSAGSVHVAMGVLQHHRPASAKHTMPSACMAQLHAASQQHAQGCTAVISLARRYLGPAGEGASAQVVLAQDELRRGSPPVVLKIMRRHLAAAGQKVLFPASCYRTCSGLQRVTQPGRKCSFAPTGHADKAALLLF